VLEAFHVDERRWSSAGTTRRAHGVARRDPGAEAVGGDPRAQRRDPPERPGHRAEGPRKSAYLFRGEKDTSYTQPMMDLDRKHLEAFKIAIVTEVKPA
jgi:hypothetical protein